MPWDIIRKEARCAGLLPNLRDYAAEREAFTWKAVGAELAMPGGLNVAYHGLDRHVAEGRGGKLALRWLGKAGERRDISYSELLALSNRFANLLRDLGVGKGERVFSLLARVPELYIAALGTLRNGSVFSPLFSAFGPEPVRTRMAIGEAKVLVTTAAFYRRKVADWRHELPGLKHVRWSIAAEPKGLRARSTSMRRWHDPVTSRTSPPPGRRTSHYCTSPAAPRAGQRARCTSMKRSSPIT